MTTRTWQPVQYCYCQHVQHLVALEAELTYPAELLPEQPPRVTAHRCSCGMECNQDERPSCLWSGTNPTFDPFLEF